jgi:hypothetical protein
MHDLHGRPLTNLDVLQAVAAFLASPADRNLLPVELRPEAAGILAWAMRGVWKELLDVRASAAPASQPTQRSL